MANHISAIIQEHQVVSLPCDVKARCCTGVKVEALLVGLLVSECQPHLTDS